MPSMIQRFPERVLGIGGLARVEAGWDQALDKAVALKRANLPGKESSERLRMEAELLGRLEHPAIVKVYDVVEDEVVGPMVVLDYVKGQTWQRLCTGAATPGTWRTHLNIGLILAGALGHAHDQGVLHLDIKPANVLLDHRLVPVLIDWSLAVDVQSSEHRNGTPGFVPPEWAVEPLATVASDVYQLASCLHLAWLGCLPGASDKPIEHRVPDAALSVLERALDPNPGRRYASMWAFERALFELTRIPSRY